MREINKTEITTESRVTNNGNLVVQTIIEGEWIESDLMVSLEAWQ